jgi:hypothetical protein
MNDANPRAVIGGNSPPPIPVLLAEKYESVLDGIEPLAEVADEIPEVLTGPADDAKVAEAMRALRHLRDEIEGYRKTEGQPFLDGKRETDGFFAPFVARIDAIRGVLQARGDAYKSAVKAAALAKANEEARLARVQAELDRQAAETAAAANRPAVRDMHVDAVKQSEAREQTAVAVASASAAALTRTRSATGAMATASDRFDFEVVDYSAVDLNQVRAYIKRAVVEAAIKAFVKVNKDKVPLAGVKITAAVKAVYR